jgi:hypothetical protein
MAVRGVKAIARVIAAKRPPFEPEIAAAKVARLIGGLADLRQGLVPISARRGRGHVAATVVVRGAADPLAPGGDDVVPILMTRVILETEPAP